MLNQENNKKKEKEKKKREKKKEKPKIWQGVIFLFFPQPLNLLLLFFFL